MLWVWGNLVLCVATLCHLNGVDSAKLLGRRKCETWWVCHHVVYKTGILGVTQTCCQDKKRGLEGGEGLRKRNEETTLGSLLPHLYKKVFHATVQAMPAFTPVVTTCSFFI